MIVLHKRFIAVAAAICLLLGAGPVAFAAGGEDAVLVPGATVFKALNPVFPLFQRYFYPYIGAHFHEDADPQVVDYSQNALASDRAIRQGVQRTITALQHVDGNAVVIGESMGSMVAARVAAELAAAPDAPSVDAIRFVLVVPPELGVAEYFAAGTFIPILNYRVSRLPESPYATTIVIGEYDGWSDPPDRPWNLVALLNAAFGAGLVHTFVSLIDPADVPPENITVTRNSLGALVTTYFVPTANLPLTAPIRLVIPDPLVDVLDRVIRPVGDAAYRRHDEPGDTRPYVDDGRIVWPESCGRGGAPIEAVSDDGVDLPDADPGLDASEEGGEGLDVDDVSEVPEPATPSARASGSDDDMSEAEEAEVSELEDTSTESEVADHLPDSEVSAVASGTDDPAATASSPSALGN